jgi:hypothetical protein
VPNLDHIAHFAPDQEACRLALAQLGFAPAPFSIQYHRPGPDAPLAPAGTGNHCVMLREGYLEFLIPLTDTPVAAQLRSAIGRYVGVHSIVFGTADAGLDHGRLQRAGFEPAAPIALQRPIDTAAGSDTARFTVIRVAPGRMAEGRIQYCEHHTPELVWQERWLEHPNGALGLRSALVCVGDLDAAAERYERFTGVGFEARSGKRVFHLHRGSVALYDAAALAAELGIEAPALPWIGGCEVSCRDLARTSACLAASGLPVSRPRDGGLLVCGPPAIGGLFLFREA